MQLGCHGRLVVAWWAGLPSQCLVLAVGFWAWVAWMLLCAVVPYCVCQCSVLSLCFCTSATSACAFGEAHGAFALVSGLDCFPSVPRPWSFCHCPALGPCCLCLVAPRPLWCCAASGGHSIPCRLRGRTAVDGAMLRIYTCASACWI